jgi:hypothetical protein
MRNVTIVLLVGLAACDRQHGGHAARTSTEPVPLARVGAPQSTMPGKAAGEMKLIPIPKDRAQLARLVALGYTVHQNHLHPPGVKSCPFDKNEGSVIN